MTTSVCRHPLCAQPVTVCDCVPFLGWHHTAAPHPGVPSHVCQAYGPNAKNGPGRICEPEPVPTITMHRLIAALPNLPQIPSDDLVRGEAAAIEARRDAVTFCVFCLVPAGFAVTVRDGDAHHLALTGARWLDLCGTHFLDLRNHCDQWVDAEFLDAWERRHGPRE